MLMGVRMYATAEKAREAARRLVDAGFRRESVLILTPAAGEEEKTVAGAMLAGRLSGRYARAVTDALKQNLTVVAVPLPYEGQLTLDIMDSVGPVEVETFASPHFLHDPAPLSDLLGIPVLTKRRGPTARLLSSGPSFKSFLGLPLLTRSSGSKDTSFGMPTLSRSTTQKTSSFGLPLLTRSGWSLSSMIGLPMLSRSGRRRG
ncbi:MAG: hypothetical protein P8188_09840 [Gemmatimonadota bacterium]|jgi:hypothetical protein